MPITRETVEDLIASDKVVIFSKTHCPYCKMAKEVFDKLKQAYTAIELDKKENGGEIQDILGDITGARTVPRVFVNKECLGAYAWSGYGTGLLGNLRDAVLAAETVFSDLFENVITVAYKIKDIHEVFDAAVEENCNFQCPHGAIPKPHWNHKPQSNGCGSLGIEINQEYLPLEEMTKCCNFHDICYDTCNLDKEKCDFEFKRCLYKYCEGYHTTGVTIVNTCKAAAKLLFTGTTALGCKSFLDAQQEACYCGDKNSKNKKPKRAAQAGGRL